MNGIILPTKKIPASIVDPRNLVIFGMPKINPVDFYRNIKSFIG